VPLALACIPGQGQHGLASGCAEYSIVFRRIDLDPSSICRRQR